MVMIGILKNSSGFRWEGGYVRGRVVAAGAQGEGSSRQEMVVSEPGWEPWAGEK